MIVDLMTFGEVFAEVWADRDNINAKWEHLAADFHRRAVKARTFPYTRVYEHTTPRKNTWLMVATAYRRNIFGTGGSTAFLCLQKYPRGYAAHVPVMDDTGQSYLITFHPHFFDRYKQYTETDKSGRELITDFIMGMGTPTNDGTENLSGIRSRTPDAFHTCFKQGIGLGRQITNDHYILNTFITYDMCGYEQNRTFGQIREEMPEYKDHHKKAWGKIHAERLKIPENYIKSAQSQKGDTKHNANSK